MRVFESNENNGCEQGEHVELSCSAHVSKPYCEQYQNENKMLACGGGAPVARPIESTRETAC
jgi:hypothetical protein